MNDMDAHQQANPKLNRTAFAKKAEKIAMNHVNMTNKGRSNAFKTPMPFRKLTSDLLYTDGKRTVATIPRSHSKD